MRKTCVQPVLVATNTVDSPRNLSTVARVAQLGRWIKPRVTPTSLHNFSVQFYPNNVYDLTGVYPQFSHLPTALIINTKSQKKENNLLGTGG
jgi:hypothetical protein